VKIVTCWPTAMLTLALIGCATPAKVINAYSGPPRSDPEVAILFTPEIESSKNGRSGGLLSAVGATTVGSFMDGYPRATKVLPGEHLIKVGCPFIRDLSFRLVRAKFEAGHYYELVCEGFSVAAIDRGTSYRAVEQMLSDSLKEQLRR
jgi:hypothetical protein